ncbi:hypothetical protein ACQ86G_19675 [Roseateles chitinivorans]|uniref:hypothetical protein n=1 Tax=Roseateles chitinivorans TaxID=2917965 RepID=UPI003D66544B
MKQFSIFLTAFCVTLVAAAAIAQTTEPPATGNASRRQSGTVGPPLDAASMNQPAASATRSPPSTGPAGTPAPATAPTQSTSPSPTHSSSPVPSPAPAPEAEPADVTPPAATAPAEAAKPAAGSRASRRASGRVTEADGSAGGLPVRPDRN